jgi:hypothetical protein
MDEIVFTPTLILPPQGGGDNMRKIFPSRRRR